MDNRREAPPLSQCEGYLSDKEPINYHYLSVYQLLEAGVEGGIPFLKATKA
jgi:hypothetical protein